MKASLKHHATIILSFLETNFFLTIIQLPSPRRKIRYFSFLQLNSSNTQSIEASFSSIEIFSTLYVRYNKLNLYWMLKILLREREKEREEKGIAKKITVW